MISKKQASAAGDALIHNRRKELERKDSRVTWYPELNRIAFGERSTVLANAKQQAWRSWVVIALIVLGIVAVIGWYLSRRAGLVGFEELGLLSVPLTALVTMAHRSKTRQGLRAHIQRQNMVKQ